MNSVHQFFWFVCSSDFLSSVLISSIVIVLLSIILHPNANVASSLSAGVYNVTTSDINLNYTTVNSITITEPTQISVTTSAFDYSGSEVSCNGASDGIATAAATGGTVTGGYNYNWDDALGQSSITASALPAGIFIVNVADDNLSNTIMQRRR